MLALVLLVLLLQELLLILTDSRASSCRGLPIWGNKNHNFDAYVNVCDNKIQSDTYRYIQICTAKYSQIQSDTYRYALLSKMYMCMYS